MLLRNIPPIVVLNLQFTPEAPPPPKAAVPEEMEAKRKVSGCRLAATGSYGEESSTSPPATAAETDGFTPPLLSFPTFPEI